MNYSCADITRIKHTLGNKRFGVCVPLPYSGISETLISHLRRSFQQLGGEVSTRYVDVALLTQGGKCSIHSKNSHLEGK